MTTTGFPAGALTNFRIVESYSIVHWRLYVPTHYRSNAPLRNASDLQDTILKLRRADILAAPATDIFAIWMFCHDEKFSGIDIIKDDTVGEIEDGAFIIAEKKYIVLTTGSLSLGELLNNITNRGHSPLVFQYVHTLDRENHDSSAKFLKDLATYHAFEVAFRASILAALSLRLSEAQQYIPLGSQTLFSYIGLEENNLHPGKPLKFNPFLAKLNVDFTVSGQLILSCQNAPQPGIEQLHPQESEGIMLIEPNDDVWLAPTGIRGKYLGQYKSPSIFPNKREYPEIWKQSVVEWLDKYQLHMDSDERRLWIEVEVETENVPFYEESTVQSSTDNKHIRLLWPARYSFHRSRQTQNDISDQLKLFAEGAEGPLAFATRWLREAPLRAAQVQEAEEKEAADKARKAAAVVIDPRYGIELPKSLGAPLPYAEALLGPGGMYPTPPDAPQPTSTSASVTAVQGVTSAPLVQGQILCDQHVMPTSTALPDDNAWVLPTLPPVPDPDLGPFFSDMVTADDLSFPMLPPTDLDTTPLNDLDFYMPDNGAISDDVFASILPSGDFNFDINLGDGHNPFLPELPSTALTPNINLPNTPFQSGHPRSDSNFTGMQAGGHSNQTDSNSHLMQYQDDITASLNKLDQANIVVEPPTSSPRTRAPSGPNTSGQYPVSAHGYALPTTTGQAMHMSDIVGAEIPDPSYILNYNSQAPTPFDRNGQLLEEFNSNQLPPPVLPESPSNETESSAESVGDYEYDNNASSRKRRWSPVVENEGVGFTNRLPNGEGVAAAKRQYADLIGAILSAPDDYCLQGAFSMQRSMPPVFAKAEDDIELAQLIVEVTTQSCFCHTGNTSSELSDLRKRRIITSRIFNPFDSTVKSYVPTLQEFAALGKTPDRTPLNMTRAQAPLLFTQFSEPYIKVRKEGKGMEASASILSLWDTFELEPFYGPKDAKTICIYPEIAVDETTEFLTMMKIFYEENRFGKHENILKLSWKCYGGSSEPPYLDIMNSLLTHCVSAASYAHRSSGNIVIYVINPFPSKGAISDICYCFLRLRKKYCSLLGNSATPISGDNISLQVVPLEFIFNPLSLVVPSAESLQNLCMEVYSRVPPQPKSDFPKSFPVYLSIKAPTPVIIRYTSQAGSPFVNMQSLLHVAYSQSTDSRWVTAAWTDYLGQHQATVSFCLQKERSTASITPREVRQNIWMISMDILQAAKLHPRMVIAKVGCYSASELRDWCYLIENYNGSTARKVEVNFVAVDATPGVHLTMPQLPKKTQGPNASTADPSSTATSGSTPVPTNTSERPHSTAQTPSTPAVQTPSSQNPNSRYKAYDKADQAWGVLLSHRPDIATESMRCYSVKKSGYLIYPDAMNENEGFAAMAVHLIHPARRSVDLLLLMILQNYRQLTTLSKVRGFNASQYGHALPWHIATALRGQEILSQTL